MKTAQDILKIEKWRDGLQDGVGGIVQDPSGEDGIYVKHTTTFEWFPVPTKPENISQAIRLAGELYKQYTQPRFSNREDQMKYLIWLMDEIDENLEFKEGKALGPERN